jgi:antitoxin component YwqK of YwqJK toxin-antitoxin module
VAKEYYPNGQVRYIYHYVNDKFEGDSIQYYPNGQVHVMVGHKNNQKHGLYQEFYEDGQLMAEYHFEGGVWHGAAMEYFPTGVVSRKMHFAQGQLQGLMTEFYNNKRIHLRLNYIAGQKQGLCRIFNEKGYHLSNRFFINNRPLFEEHIFDKKPVYNVLDITGSAFKHMDQYKSIREIIMTWSEVLVQNPQREDAFFKRSLEYLKLGNIADAVNDLSESLRLDPHFAAAYAVRGCARNILKDMVGANEDFKKAKDLGYAHLEEWESKISLEMLSLFV